MDSPTVNFYPQKLFQSHITKMDFVAEVVEQRELTGLVGSFVHQNVKPKSCRETIGKAFVEIALLVEQPHTPSAFPGFEYQLNGPGIQPFPALCNQLVDCVVGKSSAMLFPQFKLHIEFSRMGHLHDAFRFFS
jgi:hypothetical protein